MIVGLNYDYPWFLDCFDSSERVCVTGELCGDETNVITWALDAAANATNRVHCLGAVPVMFVAGFVRNLTVTFESVGSCERV